MKKKESKTVDYFDMFAQAAQVSCDAARQLCELMADFTDVESKKNALHETEHRGDSIYHTLYAHLNREFITPIEREDILAVAQAIDDATDAIEDVALRFFMLSITAVRPEAVEMTGLICRAAEKMRDAASELGNYKKSKTLMPLIVEVNTIEEEGDRLYHKLVRKLYQNEKDLMEVIKWKEVFDTMEQALDACEDVADVMEGVILKNS